ncbi:MAG TPA: hypothetical protein VNR38_12675 [Ureibacillus sp.]|nr:hypothetical protein [Ureibacillus sp.]
MSNPGGYTLNLNRIEKKLELGVFGKFDPDKEKEFFNEFQGIISQINPSDYTLYADCSSMQVLSQEHIDNLSQTITMYKQVGFQDIVIKIETSPVIKMQLNRVARNVGANLSFIEG